MGGSSWFDLLGVEIEMVMPGRIARLLLVAQGWRVIGVGEEDSCIEAVVSRGFVRSGHQPALLKPLQPGFQRKQSPLQSAFLVRQLLQQVLQRLGKTDLDPLFTPFHRSLTDSGEPEASVHQRCQHSIPLVGGGVFSTGTVLDGRRPPVAEPGKR